MYYSDYHIHTIFSPDGQSEMEDVIIKGIKLGLKEICFTDHQEFYFDGDNIITSLDNVGYFKKYNELKHIYGNDISIKFGVEIGLQLDDKITQEITKVVQKYPFDFIIGSSHSIHNIGIGIKGGEFFQGKTKKEAYMEYFEGILNCVNKIDEFDVYGHIDYVIRYGNYEKNKIAYIEYKDILDQILKSIIHKGKGIEINTSGYRYGLEQTHPQVDILKRYKELGGQIITVGSDGHFIQHICCDFNRAYKILGELGFEYITTYEKRQPKFVKIV